MKRLVTALPWLLAGAAVIVAALALRDATYARASASFARAEALAARQRALEVEASVAEHIAAFEHYIPQMLRYRIAGNQLDAVIETPRWKGEEEGAWQARMDASYIHWRASHDVDFVDMADQPGASR